MSQNKRRIVNPFFASGGTMRIKERNLRKEIVHPNPLGVPYFNNMNEVHKDLKRASINIRTIDKGAMELEKRARLAPQQAKVEVERYKMAAGYAKERGHEQFNKVKGFFVRRLRRGA